MGVRMGVRMGEVMKGKSRCGMLLDPQHCWHKLCPGHICTFSTSGAWSISEGVVCAFLPVYHGLRDLFIVSAQSFSHTPFREQDDEEMNVQSSSCAYLACFWSS